MKSILTAIVLAASHTRPCGAAAAHRMFQHSAATATRMPAFVSTQRTSTNGVALAAATKTNAQDATVLVVDEMPSALPPLKNHYYLLRHGQSTANVQGIISSARSLAGSTKHGLTPLGVQQGVDSASPLVDMIAEDLNDESTKQVFFYSSPFARAKETAEACLTGLAGNEQLSQKVESLGLKVHTDISLVDGLMERFFGRLDGTALGTYAYVWPVDMFENTHTAFDVESVAAVSTRIRETLLDIDSHHPDGGNHIVLTSHADVLQITQAYAAGLDNVGMFSSYRFGNGEVRRMGREVESLPEPVPLEPPKRGEFAA